MVLVNGLGFRFWGLGLGSLSYHNYHNKETILLFTIDPYYGNLNEVHRQEPSHARGVLEALNP